MVRGKEQGALALTPFGVGTLALGQRKWGPAPSSLRDLPPATSQPSLIMVCEVQPKMSTTLHSYSPSKGPQRENHGGQVKVAA